MLIPDIVALMGLGEDIPHVSSYDSNVCCTGVGFIKNGHRLAKSGKLYNNC